MLLCIDSRQRSVTSSEVPVKIPAKAILALMDVLHGSIGEFGCAEVACEAAKALFEFSEHVDTMALAVMAEEHGELEIRPR